MKQLIRTKSGADELQDICAVGYTSFNLGVNEGHAEFLELLQEQPLQVGEEDRNEGVIEAAQHNLQEVDYFHEDDDKDLTGQRIEGVGEKEGKIDIGEEDNRINATSGPNDERTHYIMRRFHHLKMSTDLYDNYTSLQHLSQEEGEHCHQIKIGRRPVFDTLLASE